jgi:hypothetical protein
VVAWDAARGVQFVTLPGSPPLGVCWQVSFAGPQQIQGRTRSGAAREGAVYL